MVRERPEVSASGLAVLIVCALVLLPTLTYRMGVDQGVFAYMGTELLNGRWPYVGTWESDFPGMVFLHAAELGLLGKSIVLFRVFDLLYQLGNAYLIFRITCAVADRTGGYLAAVTYVLIYQGYGPWNTAQREGFGLLFILLGFWLYLTRGRRHPLTTASGIGLGIGVAVLFKPTLVFLAALYLPLLWQLNSQTFGIAVTAGLASAVPLATVGLLYWIRGEFSQFYEACFAYQAVYTERLAGQGTFWARWAAKLRGLGGTAVGLSLGYLPFVFFGPARRERTMLYLGYLGSVCQVLVQGTFAGYHYLPGLGIGATLIGSAFSLGTSGTLRNRSVRLGSRAVPASLLAATVILLFAVPVYLRREPVLKLVSGQFLRPPAANEFRIGTVFDFTESWDLAEYLRSRTGPDERIQVWGYEPLVYYLAERYAASRFQATHPLVMRVPGEALSPMQERWRTEFLRDVAEQRPRYVVVVRDDNWWWAPEEQTSEQLLDDFPQWKQFIEEHYTVEHSIGRFQIHARQETQAGKR